jgi:hypothetical protein
MNPATSPNEKVSLSTLLCRWGSFVEVMKINRGAALEFRTRVRIGQAFHQWRNLFVYRRYLAHQEAIFMQRLKDKQTKNAWKLWRRYAVYLRELGKVAVERDNYGSIQLAFQQWQDKFMQVVDMDLQAAQMYEISLLQTYFGEWRQRTVEEKERKKQAQLEELAAKFARMKLAKKALSAISGSVMSIKLEEQAASQYIEMRRMKGWMQRWRNRYRDQVALRQALILRSQFLQREHLRVWEKKKERRNQLVNLLLDVLTAKMRKSFKIWRDKTDHAIQVRSKYDVLRNQAIIFLARKREIIFRGMNLTFIGLCVRYLIE